MIEKGLEHMKHTVRWALVVYDLLIYVVSAVFIVFLYPHSMDDVSTGLAVVHVLLGLICTFAFRFVTRVYEQIWRYAGPSEFMRLLCADAFACVAFLLVRTILPHRISFVKSFALFALSLLGCVAIRFIYQWFYLRRASTNKLIVISLKLLRTVTGTTFADEAISIRRIHVAIVGAGSVGVMLADELLRNPKALYEPVCFVDIDVGKAGREIYGIPVLLGGSEGGKELSSHAVQEVIFALPNVKNERRKEL